MMTLFAPMLAPLAPALVIINAIWQFATSRFGLPIVVAGAIVLYYEGLPLGPVRDIPYVGAALAGLVDGRVDREYAAGQLNERLVWQEKQRLAEIVLAAKLKTKQAAIDATAQQLADSEGAHRADTLRLADLEDRIRQQKDEDSKAPDDPKQPAACRLSGIRAPISTKLDAIGR